MTSPGSYWRDLNRPISPPPPLSGQQMGSIETPGLPNLGFEMIGGVRTYTLIAQPVEQVLTDGQPMDMSIVPEMNRFMGAMNHNRPQTLRVWGYNGSSPGPVMEAIEGEPIRVILKNELPEPTSIHWHGVDLPNSMDGAGGLTQPPVMPGESFTYEFTPKQNGTVMYHSGFNMMKQDSYGLAGMLIIHPKTAPTEEPKVDRDIAILLQEWAVLPGSSDPNVMSMDFNWFTFNGKAAPSIPTITIQQGERVRLRFGNLSMDSHPIHLHGYVWDVTGTEGGRIPLAAQLKGSTIAVDPGTTRDVEFTANNPGLWRIHCHKLHHIANGHTDEPMGVMDHGGMFTLVRVIPKSGGSK
jgi:FtsP/CotA-like multicopper oxidase with cupredoxin domain